MVLGVPSPCCSMPADPARWGSRLGSPQQASVHKVALGWTVQSRSPAGAAVGTAGCAAVGAAWRQPLEQGFVCPNFPRDLLGSSSG